MIFISPASGTQAGGLSLGNWSAESHVACLSFFYAVLHWKNRRRRTVAADHMFFPFSSCFWSRSFSRFNVFICIIRRLCFSLSLPMDAKKKEG